MTHVNPPKGAFLIWILTRPSIIMAENASRLNVVCPRSRAIGSRCSRVL